MYIETSPSLYIYTYIYSHTHIRGAYTTSSIKSYGLELLRGLGNKETNKLKVYCAAERHCLPCAVHLGCSLQAECL